MAKKNAVNFETYDFTANPDKYTTEEIITIRRMMAAGQPIFLAPVKIEILEQLENLHTSFEACRTWRIGSEKITVRLTPADERTYDMLLGDLRAEHSDAIRAMRCRVPGKRGRLVRCDTKNSCAACPYGKDPADREPNSISWDALCETGWEPSEGDRTSEKALAAVEYSRIRALMDAEDPRIAPLFEDYVVEGLSIAELMDKYVLSRRRVFQLIARAREIGQQD